MSQLPSLVSALDALADSIAGSLNTPAEVMAQRQIYRAVQKLDYDTNLVIEQESDGYVDIYDLALKQSQLAPSAAVRSAAEAVLSAFGQAVIDERKRSGAPWFAETEHWPLENTHGLSVFWPLGEDLELSVPITVGAELAQAETRNMRLRDLYTPGELRYAQETSWDELIAGYYAAASTIPSDTLEEPLEPLQNPDVTPPMTTILGLSPPQPQLGELLAVEWASEDLSSGVVLAEIWLHYVNTGWELAASQQIEDGRFIVQMQGPPACIDAVAVLAVDKVGNQELPDGPANTRAVRACELRYLPIVAD
jgi:hypothetical protein